MRMATDIAAQVGETVRAAAEAITVEELALEAVERLKGLVGASQILLYRYDDDGMVQGLAGSLTHAVPSYAKELFDEDPIQKFLFAMTPTDPIISAEQSVDRKVFHGSAAYTDFYKPLDMDHLLGSWMTPHPYGAPGMTGILMTRSRRQGAFSEHAWGLLGAVLPAFQATARRSARMKAEQATRRREHEAIEVVLGGMTAAALLVLDGQGRIVWLSRAAERLLGAHLGEQRTLPDTLVAAARRLSMVARGEGVAAAPASAIAVRLDDGTVVRAELGLRRTASGEPLVVATLTATAATAATAATGTPGTIGRQAPLQLAASRVAEQHGLTRAETAVLGLLAEGRSNQEIGASLYVSVETVKTHVQRILGKLDVRSRTQAALLVSGGLAETSIDSLPPRSAKPSRVDSSTARW